MTAAYAAVANGGYRVTPTGVLAVVDGRGQVRAGYMEPMRTQSSRSDAFSRPGRC